MKCDGDMHGIEGWRCDASRPEHARRDVVTRSGGGKFLDTSCSADGLKWADNQFPVSKKNYDNLPMG